MREGTFDRISTREELFEALDMLCHSRTSGFAEKPDTDERSWRNDLAGTPSQASTFSSSDDLDLESAADEIMSLTDLFAGRTERPN